MNVTIWKSVSLVHNNQFIFAIKAILKHDSNIKRNIQNISFQKEKYYYH